MHALSTDRDTILDSMITVIRQRTGAGSRVQSSTSKDEDGAENCFVELTF